MNFNEESDDNNSETNKTSISTFKSSPKEKNYKKLGNKLKIYRKLPLPLKDIPKMWEITAEALESNNSTLYSLIMHINAEENVPNLEFIDDIPTDVLKELLEMHTAYGQPTQLLQYAKSIKAIEKFNRRIDEEFLKDALRKWRGWMLYDFKNGVNKIMCANLNIYLKNCFKVFLEAKDKCVFSELQEYDKNNEDTMIVTSSLIDLKTLFYHEPHKFGRYYRNVKVVKSDSSNEPSGLFQRFPSPEFLLNWPFVSTRIEIPGFKMVHQNVNINKFKLIDLKKGYKPFTGCPQNMNLYFQPSAKTTTIPTSLILAFLLQFKLFINTTEAFKSQKIELTNILSEFQKDLTLCTGIIETNTNYCKNISPYPYVRYLGMPSKGNSPSMSPFDQAIIKDSQVNVRLQQLTFPSILFNVETFQTSAEIHNNKVKFIFETDSFKDVKDIIIYSCTLCKDTFTVAADIIFHLSELHGVEPDWKCSICNVYFTTRYLSFMRWTHTCKKVW